MVSRILPSTATKGMCTHKGSDLNKYRWNWLLQKDRFGSKSSDLSLGKFVVIFEVFEHHSSIHGCLRKFMNFRSKGRCVAISPAPSKSHQVLRHFIFPVKSLILVVQFNGQFCSSNGCKLPKVCYRANFVPLQSEVNIGDPKYIGFQTIVGLIFQINATVTGLSNTIMESLNNKSLK